MSEQIPDYSAGIEDLAQKEAATRTLVEVLGGRPELAGILIEQLVEISVSAEALAIDAAVSAVQSGRISRRNAADRLRMHSHTLQSIIDKRSEHDSQEGV